MPPNVLTGGYISFAKSKSEVVYTDDEVKRILAKTMKAFAGSGDFSKLPSSAHEVGYGFRA